MFRFSIVVFAVSLIVAPSLWQMLETMICVCKRARVHNETTENRQLASDYHK